MARSPANTRATFSLQIGMMTAVRASAGKAVADETDRVMAWRSRPQHSSTKPVTAVQNPSETQANRMAERLRIASSSGCCPWYGKTLVTMP